MTNDDDDNDTASGGAWLIEDAGRLDLHARDSSPTSTG